MFTSNANVHLFTSQQTQSMCYIPNRMSLRASMEENLVALNIEDLFSLYDICFSLDMGRNAITSHSRDTFTSQSCQARNHASSSLNARMKGPLEEGSSSWFAGRGTLRGAMVGSNTTTVASGGNFTSVFVHENSNNNENGR